MNVVADSVINVVGDKDELFLSVLYCFYSFIFILWLSDASQFYSVVSVDSFSSSQNQTAHWTVVEDMIL